MSQDKKTIAGREEVIERAIKKLKEEHELYLTKKEMEDVYEATYKYIKKRLDEEPFLSVKLRGLGTAYWTQYFCAEIKRRKMYNTRPPDERRAKLWKDREDEIEEYYQNNQRKRNVRKKHRLYHIFPPLLKGASLRGYKIEDIEEKQNKIE